MNEAKPPLTHIKLTSHPSGTDKNVPLIQWGAPDPQVRGPIIGSTTNPKNHNVIGTHAGSYAIYRALAVAAGQLDPHYIPDFTNTAPIDQIGPFPGWGDPAKIVSLDPFGHIVSLAFRDQIAQGMDIRPTIAITKAHINIPELATAIAAGRLQPDGTILKANGEVAVTKAAIDPVWYLPGIAQRFGCDETLLRYTIFENTAGMFPELITRPDLSVFLPPIGGTTVYFFGDLAAVSDTSKELTCRVHDECNGSDVFGSDICTCRPYLTHGIELCIQSAQRGGSGLIVYNRKEGRALGEVTKFLVYNARKRQEGGDTAQNYFVRTECVAGVQDMRFQELMPDVLNWLGITKIDRFVSMSNVKYDAIIKQGITIKERIAIPAELIPADAKVEMSAKQAAGYFSDCIPGKEEIERSNGETYRSRLLIDYLDTLTSIRSSCDNVLALAQNNNLLHFKYNPENLESVIDLVISLMLRQYPKLDIPIHSRWRHFETAGVDRLQLLRDKVEPQFLAKSMVELVIVSSLLDAGAGSQWQYVDHRSGTTLNKSEGLAAASFNLFMQGFFSSDKHHLYQADALGLQKISEDLFMAGLQISEKNSLIGINGRLSLLHNLGVCVQQKSEYFAGAQDSSRLGNIVDYWMRHVDNDCLPMTLIFTSLLEALRDIWPGRYSIDGLNLGDVWIYPPNKNDLNPRGFIPFHKLVQWLCYSLIEPLELAGVKVTEVEQLTGLPEYRNGGLFVDLAVITPKNEDVFKHKHKLESGLIVEWRALTVALLDLTAAEIVTKLDLSAAQMPLSKVLQGGTWMAGRMVAFKLRSDGRPPFILDSDGTVF